MAHKPKISAYDFDGTITCKDSLVRFLIQIGGRRKLFSTMLSLAPKVALMKLGLLNSGKVKEQLLGRYLKGVPMERFLNACHDFSSRNSHILRPAAVMSVDKALDNGEIVVVITSSVVDWVIPFFNNRNITFIGTKLEVDENNVLTGRLATPNCYGQEKLNRFREQFPDGSYHSLTYYGDGAGDHQMLEFSTDPYYKPFREKLD